MAAAPARPIVDLNFGGISGATVPDRSGSANDGAGRKGAVGSEAAWSPGTTADTQGNPAVVFDGGQQERIEIPNRSGSPCSSCRAIAWVTDEDPSHGSAKVYVYGTLKATVGTRSSSA